MQIILIIIVILIGFALIIADLLFIPGGIMAICGGTLIVGAIISSWKLLGHNTAIVVASGSALLAGLITYISFKFRLWKMFVEEGTESRAKGFSSHKGSLEQLTGKTGEVITDLRPAGTVIVDGKKYDGVTEGDFIEKGKTIIVIGVSTGQVKVRNIENSQSS